MAFFSFFVTLAIGVSILLLSLKYKKVTVSSIYVIFAVTLIHFIIASTALNIQINELFIALTITPAIEEVGRMKAIKHLKSVSANAFKPKYIAAFYVALIYAAFEILSTLYKYSQSEGNYEALNEYGADVYFAVAFPVFYIIDIIGHGVIGLVMIVFWNNRALRFSAPFLLHSFFNYLGKL